jgi:MYXO-CTERM domain-containing protein
MHATLAIVKLLAQQGATVALEPDQEVLFVQRHAIPITCPAPDGGPCGDADGGTTCAPGSDAGVCGATDAVTLVVQPKFDLDNGAAVILTVTPSPPAITLGAANTFDGLDADTAPTVIPIYHDVPDESLCDDGSQIGCDFRNLEVTPPDAHLPLPPLADGAPTTSDGGPSAQWIGPYAITVLSARTSADLGAWLDADSFTYTQSDLDELGTYLDLGWTAVAIQVSSAQTYASEYELAPVALTYAASAIQVPMIGSASYTVYLADDGRDDLTDAHVAFADRRYTLGAPFLGKDVITGTPGPPLVAFRVAGDPTARDTVTETVDRSVKPDDCPKPQPICGCGCQVGGGAPLPGPPLAFAALFLVLRRRR